jgi:hypothetical protein
MGALMPYLALEHLIYATYSQKGSEILRKEAPEVNKQPKAKAEFRLEI